MVKTKQISLKDLIYLRTLTQKCVMNDPVKYPTLSKYPKSTLCRHAKKSLDSEEIDGRKSNRGRPLKTSRRDERLIKLQIGLRPKKNIALFPAHRPGENFFMMPPGRNQ